MWPNPQETADLVTFSEENLNGKLHFCAVNPANAYLSVKRVELVESQSDRNAVLWIVDIGEKRLDKKKLKQKKQITLYRLSVYVHE